MRLFLLTILLIACLFSRAGLTRELKQDEIELREIPQLLFERLTKTVTVPSTPLTSAKELAAEASRQGLTPAEFTELITLLVRADLQAGVINPNKAVWIPTLVQSLEASASSQYEQAMALMLKARALARLEQKFSDSVAIFNQALERDIDSTSLKSQLLRLNIHEQLGGIHLLLNQDILALEHLLKFRELAHELNNNYLIANSEGELGKYYIKKQALAEALEHYSAGLKLSDEQQYPFQRAFLQMQLAKVYRDLDHSDDALSHAMDAAKAFEQLKNDSYLSATLSVIATTYAQNNQWNRAVDTYLNVQQVDLRNRNYTMLARTYHNLGEAYSKLDDHNQALTYLTQANKMFIDSKSTHFQVYNELLLADVLCKLQRWQACTDHADIGLKLAQAQKLPQLLLESRQLKLKAAAATKDHNTVIQEQSHIIRLLEKTPENEKINQRDTTLAEQKLQLDLQESAKQLSKLKTTLSTYVIAITTLAFLAVVLLALLFIVKSRKSKLNRTIDQQTAQMALEPATGLPGLIAFKDAISTPSNKAIGLLRFSNAQESDLQLGHSLMQQYLTNTASIIESTSGIKSYVIRPGLLALTFDEPIDAAEGLLRGIRSKLSTAQVSLTYASTPMQLAFINLPLLPNTEVFIASEIYLEMLEMAVAALSDDHAIDDRYLGLRALDFTPPTVFSHPVYLQLEKALGRGLIRFETNCDKDQLCWPTGQVREEKLNVDNQLNWQLKQG